MPVPLLRATFFSFQSRAAARVGLLCKTASSHMMSTSKSHDRGFQNTCRIKCPELRTNSIYRRLISSSVSVLL